MKEEWRVLPGYEGLYLVSNLGNVYSTALGRNLITNAKRGYYKKVSLRKGKTTQTIGVHTLVARAFLKITNTQVNHKDGVKGNNIVDNLEWVSQKENTLHASRMGLLKPQNGVLNNNSKITFEIAEEIRELYKNESISQDAIAKMYHISGSTVSDVVNNKRWTNEKVDKPTFKHKQL